MANLHDIERRINSVKSTRQITSTMRMVASAKVGRSQARLEKSKPYASCICKMLGSVASGDCEYSHPLLEKHEDIKNSLIIVVVSDKGLAGGFNSNILRAAQGFIKSNNKLGKSTQVIACGKKAHSYFSFRGIELKQEYVGSSDNPVFDTAEEIGNYCIEQYSHGNIDEVVLIYNKCKNSMEQTVEQLQVLPCLTENFVDLSNGNNDQNDDFEKEIIYDPDPASVLQGLLPTYIRTVIFNALLDSAAGEQVARRVAMQAATDNADEMVDTLTRLYNSVRQGAITTELNEIVGGAEALGTD